MKELFAAFNTDFFRALTTLIIPGSVAISTWTVHLLLAFASLKRIFDTNPVERAFVLFMVTIFAGFIIEDMGSRVESLMDRRADRESKGQHSSEWYAYLRMAFICEPIGRRYIRTLVTRLKFELGTTVAMLIADFGLLVLWASGSTSCRLSVILLAVSLSVAAYLGLLEAPATHKLLAKARSTMLQEIRIVK